MNSEIIYLAAPYSHADPEVMERRFHAINRAAAKLMREGKHVFSPISHCHPIAVSNSLPRDFEYWKGYNRAFLRVCGLMTILKLEGWEKSTGVAGEERIACEFGIPVDYMEPVDE